MTKASSANIAASIRQRLRTMQDRITPRAVNIAVVELEAAITATFDRRQTGIPVDKLPGLANTFTGDPAKQT